DLSVRLPGGQRRGAVAGRHLAAQLDETADRDSQALPGAGPRLHPVAAPGQPAGARLPPRVPGPEAVDRLQPVALRPGGRAGPAAPGRRGAGGGVRHARLPGDRRAALSTDDGPTRLLLVRPGREPAPARRLCLAAAPPLSRGWRSASFPARRRWLAILPASSPRSRWSIFRRGAGSRGRGAR